MSLIFQGLATLPRKMNAKEIKREIGRRLQKARQDQELTLTELSRRLNGVLSWSRISNYEQGERLPGPWEILLLNKELRSSPTYLMCLDEGNDMLVAKEKFMRDWEALPENIRMDFARKISLLALAYKDTVTVGDIRIKKKAPKLAKVKVS